MAGAAIAGAITIGAEIANALGKKKSTSKSKSTAAPKKIPEPNPPMLAYNKDIYAVIGSVYWDSYAGKYIPPAGYVMVSNEEGMAIAAKINAGNAPSLASSLGLADVLPSGKIMLTIGLVLACSLAFYYGVKKYGGSHG